LSIIARAERRAITMKTTKTEDTVQQMLLVSAGKRKR
jgi:hypothetical protein